jgi:hypothetical protein
MLVAVLALALAQASFAQENTNAAAASTTNAVVQPAQTNGSNSANALGLPPETLNRLSPEQIMTLMQQRRPVPPPAPNTPDVLHSIAALVIPVVVPLGAFAMVIAIVGMCITQKHRRNKILHETVRMMIEKGQPIPPELLQPQEAERRPRKDLRNGLILVAVGIALLLMNFHGNGFPSGSAYIPLLIGVAFLVAWIIESKKNGGQVK